MAFSNPEQVIRESGIVDGNRVVDFGAGSGHYSMAVAHTVGARGKVYAVDIQKGLLSRIKREASEKSLRNIEVVRGDLEEGEGSTLRGGMADAVVLTNTLFQTTHRSAVLEEAKRVLKPGGRVLFVEWSGAFGGIGPSPADVVTEASARELFDRAGFTFERAIKDAGEHHYGFIMRKPDNG